MENEKYNPSLIYVAFIISLGTNFSFPLFVSLLLKNGISENYSLITHLLLLLSSALLLPFWGYKLDRIKPGYLFVLPFLLLAIGTFGIVQLQYGLPLFLFCFALGASITTFLARRIIESKNLKGSLKSNILKSYVLENFCLATSCLLAFTFSEHYKTLLIIDFISTSLFLLYMFRSFYRGMKPKLSTNKLELNLGLIFKDKEIILFIILLILTFSHMSSLPLLYNRNSSDPIRSMAIMLIINTFTIVATSGVMKRFPSPKKSSVIILSSLLLGLGYGLASFSFSYFGIISSSVLWSVAETLLLPLISFEVIDRFHEEDQGIAVGVKEFVMKGSIVLSTLFTLLVKNLGQTGIMLTYVLVPILALGFLLSKKEFKTAV